MALNNLGYLLAVALGLASVSYQSYITDTDGNNHSTVNLPNTLVGTPFVIYADVSNATYTASSLNVNVVYNNTTYNVLTESLSVTKQSNEVLVVIVYFSYSTPDPISAIVLPALVVYLSGLNLSSVIPSSSIYATYTLVQYATTTSNNTTTCSSSVSSENNETQSISSWSVSGNTLTIEFTISYGSCQQVTNIPVVVVNGYTYSGTATSTSVCGYGSSCSITVTLSITV